MILMDINGIQLPMPDHNAHYGSLYPIDRWFFFKLKYNEFDTTVMGYNYVQ